MIRTLRVIRWVSLGLVLLLAVKLALELRLGGGSAATDAPPGTATVAASGPPLGSPFNLTDDRGHPVSDAEYRGRWMLVFFG